MLTNAEFIDSMYQNVLLRTPDTGGRAYFLNRLDQGLATRTNIAETFLTSAEVQDIPTGLAGIYQAVLGRQPDLFGLQSWAGVIHSGATLTQVAQQMSKSTEFAQKYAGITSSSSLIDMIYQNALGRTADAAGLAYWQGIYNATGDLGGVATSVALSDEGRARNDATMKKTLIWHAVIGNEPTAAQIAALPNDSSALAVAIMQQPTASQSAFSFWENTGTLYGNLTLTGAVVLDLPNNTLTMNNATQSLTQGSLPSAIHADFSLLSPPTEAPTQAPTTTTTTTTTEPTEAPPTVYLVTVTGDDANNTYVGSDLNDSINGGKGNDAITLGSGVDSIYFADSYANNGMDTINQFTLGTDQLNLTAFLNKTTTTLSMLAINAAQNLQQAWSNGDVLVLQGHNLNTDSAIASLFGTGRPIANPTGAAKAVVIAADVTGDAGIWYLANQVDTLYITPDEITQVGLLTGINNLLDQNTLISLRASTQANALARVIYDTNSLLESTSNDGSIRNSITITSIADGFVGRIGSAIGTVTNVPAGLTAKLIKTSDTTATLSLIGKATTHTLANSTTNLTVTFAATSFLSGKAAIDAVRNDLNVDFLDLNIQENRGILTLVGAVPNNTSIDLTKDSITSGTTPVSLVSGSLGAVTTVDLSGVTTTAGIIPTISVIGSSAMDAFISAPTGAKLSGGGGIDGYLLGNGADTVVFESSAAMNGIDVISNFKLGAAGDTLDFSAFLNVTGKNNIATKNAISTTALAWNNGDVLVVQGDTIDTAAKVAALFGAGKVFAAPTGQAKAVVVVSDLIGDSTVWYITNQSTLGITAIDSTEVQEVALLTGINNLSLVGFAANNFA